MTIAATRTADLRRMLNERQRQLQDDVQSRIRDGRSGRPKEVSDDLEHSDIAIQRDLELALLQMKSETLTRVQEALVRLDAGDYGFCRECQEEISERRLEALPFAVRCQACEEKREQDRGQARRLALRRGTLFPNGIGS